MYIPTSGHHSLYIGRRFTVLCCIISLVILPLQPVMAYQESMEYYHHNHQGSLLEVYDGATNKRLLSQAWSPWGERQILHSAASGNGNNERSLLSRGLPAHMGYTGHKRLLATGLDFAGDTRLYDARLKRFLNSDDRTTGGVRGQNRYSYAYNNPMTYIDPDGRSPISALRGFSSALGAWFRRPSTTIAVRQVQGIQLGTASAMEAGMRVIGRQTSRVRSIDTSHIASIAKKAHAPALTMTALTSLVMSMVALTIGPRDLSALTVPLFLAAANSRINLFVMTADDYFDGVQAMLPKALVWLPGIAPIMIAASQQSNGAGAIFSDHPVLSGLTDNFTVLAGNPTVLGYPENNTPPYFLLAIASFFSFTALSDSAINYTSQHRPIAFPFTRIVWGGVLSTTVTSAMISLAQNGTDPTWPQQFSPIFAAQTAVSTLIFTALALHNVQFQSDQQRAIMGLSSIGVAAFGIGTYGIAQLF